MVVFRKILPAEIPAYRDHLLRLNERDRRSRFLTAASDETIRSHCSSLDWFNTIIIAAFIDGELRGAVELTGVPGQTMRHVELAVSVELPWQNTGTGSELVRRALLVSQNRSVHRVTMICLRENRRMQYIARKNGCTLDFDDADVMGDVLVPPPTHISVLMEMMQDGVAVFGSVLQQWQVAQDRALMPLVWVTYPPREYRNQA